MRRYARITTTKTGVEIVRKALSWPARQIAINAAKTGRSSSARSLKRINTRMASMPRTASTSTSSQGHHRPNQGCAGGAAECSIDRRASDHHGSHGRRKAEEGQWGARLCLAVAWAAWTIKPTLNRNDEGPGFLPGLFLVPQPRQIRASVADAGAKCIGVRSKIDQ